MQTEDSRELDSLEQSDPGFRFQVGDVSGVFEYVVYSYQYLDDLSFLRDPYLVFEDKPRGSLALFLEFVKARLRKSGWEGDGDLRVLWLPPFVNNVDNAGMDDTFGTYVWCVKQSNNGFSWIASKTPLPFKGLFEVRG